MGCFTNYIGIKKTDTPTTGIYIYDFGISLAEGAAIADSQAFNTGYDLLNSKINHAIMQVKDELKKYLYPYFRFESVLENVKTGTFNYNYHTSTKLGYGITVEKVSSRLSKLYVERIQVLVNTSGSATINIIDGGIITPFTFTAVAGTVYEIQTKYKAEQDEIEIKWATAELVDTGEIDNDNCSCNNKWISVSATDDSNYNYGIVADINIICDVDELFCILSQDLKFPIAWKACAEIIDYAILTDRINMFTLTQDITEAKERRDYFEKKYEESFKSLLATLPQLLKNIDQYCINCKQTRYAEVI